MNQEQTFYVDFYVSKNHPRTTIQIGFRNDVTYNKKNQNFSGFLYNNNVNKL